MNKRLTLFAALLGGCATYGVPLPEVAADVNSTLYVGPTLLRPGDRLDLRFPRKVDWNEVSLIREDGRAGFPLLGDLRVAGMSLADLNEMLEERYRSTPEAPEVVADLDDPGQQGRQGSRAVTVTGEVINPGLVELSGERLTLLEALGRAGGHLKASALLGNVLLLRRSPSTGAYRAWRIDARLDYWDQSEPVYLQPNDLVFVPNTPIDNVNIWIDTHIRQNIPFPGLVPFALGVSVSN
ncbi:MAG: polysaccharide biosynthesis/export family protein [Planctomycetota bacterium]